MKPVEPEIGPGQEAGHDDHGHDHVPWASGHVTGSSSGGGVRIPIPLLALLLTIAVTGTQAVNCIGGKAEDEDLAKLRERVSKAEAIAAGQSEAVRRIDDQLDSIDKKLDEILARLSQPVPVPVPMQSHGPRGPGEDQ